MKKATLLIIYISITSFSQNEVTDFFYESDQGNYENSQMIAQKLDHHDLSQVLQNYLKILRKGMFDEGLKEKNNSNDPIVQNIYQLNKALYFYAKEGNEERAFKILRTNLDNALSLDNATLICMNIRYILEIYERFHINIDDLSYKYFVNLYREHAYNLFHTQLSSLYDYRITQRYSFKDSIIFNSSYNTNKREVDKITSPLFSAKRDITHGVYHLMHTKNPDSLIFYIKRAKETLEGRMGYFEKECLIAAKINSSSASILLGDPSKAIAQLNEIEITSSDYLFENLKKFISYRKHLAYKNLEDSINSLIWHNKYLVMELKANQASNLQHVSEYETKYQTAEKEKQLLLEQEENKRNRNIAYGLGGGVVAVSLIGFLLFTNSRRKQRIAEQQSEIEVQKTEKILKEQELTTIDAMISGQEKERQRLASDLHDSVGATLAAAKLQFDHLSKNRDKPQEMEPMYDKTAQLLEDAYTEIRSLAHAKNSGVIAKNGLLPAVQQLARNASGTSKLNIEVEDFGLDERIENSLEISIFRMIQEIVTNIVKHAEASSAGISITQHEESLNIIIEDNGKGFDPKKVVTKDGMGLSSIERRIEHLEGSFEVDSTIGKGTTIIIDIPL